MVETSKQSQKEFNRVRTIMYEKQMQQEFKKVRAMIDEIESQTERADSSVVEEFEELKTKIRPKMVVAARELNNVMEILKAFWEKHLNSGRTVCTKSVQFYLDELKFDP